MPAELSTLTSKGQVTVPKAVRDALRLRQGSRLRWELEDGSVRVRVVTPLELTHLQGVEDSLKEWAGPTDAKAFAHL